MRRGVLAGLEVEETATGAEFVDDRLYCLVMYLRTLQRPRPTPEAMLEAIVLGACAFTLDCRACGRPTRHEPMPRTTSGYRCSRCAGVRQVRCPKEEPCSPPPETGQLSLLGVA